MLTRFGNKVTLERVERDKNGSYWAIITLDDGTQRDCPVADLRAESENDLGRIDRMIQEAKTI